MIDTHSHIQFKIFDQDRTEVIKRAVDAGVTHIVAVGTDVGSSKKAIEIAEEFPEVYAVVGIHPHHVYEHFLTGKSIYDDLEEIEKLIDLPKVVGIGETGLDTHPYPTTKYPNYQVSPKFLELQKKVFIEHTKLAKRYQKSLVIHNRGAAAKLLETLENYWDDFFTKRSVFHCCEPSQELLEFAKKYQVFIGVDGDVTYDPDKQKFVKQIPLELLVLETDSPFFCSRAVKKSRFSKKRT